MDITEKAKTYVASQTEAFANAIEKAYMQGYNDAVEENSKEHIKIIEDGVEYIDLGLPSGTLWALNNPKFVAYHDSQKLNIPTKEQIDELVKFVRWEIRYIGNNLWKFEFIDAKARRYMYYTHSYTKGSGMTTGDLYMWFRSELSEKGNAKVVQLYNTNSSYTAFVFPGYKAFAFLVK